MYTFTVRVYMPFYSCITVFINKVSKGSIQEKHHFFRTRGSNSKTIIQKGLFSCHLAVKQIQFCMCLGRD